MNQILTITCRRIIFVIYVSLLISCAPASFPQPTSPGSESSSTQEPTPKPTTSADLAVLSVVDAPVRLLRGDNSEVALNSNQKIPVGTNDLITVEKPGQANLDFGNDRVHVEFFSGSGIAVSAITYTPGGSLTVNLNRPDGHTLVRVNKDADATVLYESEVGSIKTRGDDTEFIVCNAPKVVTCLLVTRGAVEAFGQGDHVTLKAGEASFIENGKAWLSPICVRTDEFNTWLQKMEDKENVQALGELVGGWYQDKKDCSPTVQTAPVTPTAFLARSEGMVKINAGNFTIGSTEFADEFHTATGQVTLSEFWIDIYLVTNAQFQEFMNATGHPPPGSSLEQENLPVEGVNWDDAKVYCEWVNKRLPTEAEWEAAARGPGLKPPLYPWGPDSQAGGKIDAVPQTQRYKVGAYDFNHSAFGLYDMVGNVWQWVAEPYGPVSNGMHILRGGRYGYLKDAAYRQTAAADSDALVSHAGFRCAASQVEGN